MRNQTLAASLGGKKPNTDNNTGTRRRASSLSRLLSSLMNACQNALSGRVWAAAPREVPGAAGAPPRSGGGSPAGGWLGTAPGRLRLRRSSPRGPQPAQGLLPAFRRRISAGLPGIAAS